MWFCLLYLIIKIIENKNFKGVRYEEEIGSFILERCPICRKNYIMNVLKGNLYMM